MMSLMPGSRTDGNDAMHRKLRCGVNGQLKAVALLHPPKCSPPASDSHATGAQKKIQTAECSDGLIAETTRRRGLQHGTPFAAFGRPGKWWLTPVIIARPDQFQENLFSTGSPLRTIAVAESRNQEGIGLPN
jgi:hypothetical protein